MKKQETNLRLSFQIFIVLLFIVTPAWINFINGHPGIDIYKGDYTFPISFSLIMLPTLYATNFFSNYINKKIARPERGYIKELCILAKDYNDFLKGEKVVGFLRKKGLNDDNMIDFSGDFKYNEIKIETEKFGPLEYVQLKQPLKN